MFKTKAGRWRRLDVIVAIKEEHAACVLGWTGSRQWLRFLRNHAAKRGMALNSHRSVAAEHLLPHMDWVLSEHPPAESSAPAADKR